jgi:hypothetical protein
MQRAQRLKVALFKMDGKSEQPIKSEELSGQKELTDLPIRLEAGRYRWRVTAYGSTNQMIDEAEEEFTVTPKNFEPPERMAITGGFGLCQFGYSSTTSTWGATFNAGMTGPILTASYLFTPSFGFLAHWKRMDFNVYNTGLRSEDILGGFTFSPEPWKLFGKFPLRMIVGLRGGYEATPEVLGTSATTVSTSTLSHWVISPSIKFIHDRDEVGSFFFGANVGLPFAASGSQLGDVSSTISNVALNLNAGFGLRLSTTWGIEGQIGTYLVSESYQSATESVYFNLTGYQGTAAVLFYY